MDKLSLQKAIDSLKNTECNTKEKISKFDVIQNSLSALQNHSNFKSFLSNSVQILLLFCEDNDSNCRISAEENLCRIIRNAERQNQIVLVQIDLYHEMKKNGNERSLRICLNLFSHYSHLIKHRRRKVYAQNLLPCLLAVGKRKEPLVIESLAEFMKSFSKNLLNCLTEGETMKLVDLFLDNLSVECAIKRRCAAQNIISMLAHSVKKDFVIKSIIVKIQDNLNACSEMNSMLGTLGLLRLLVPILITSKEHHQKVLELLETCLTYLKTESNHSMINGNLEVVNALLNAANSSIHMKELLSDSDKMVHKEMLLSRRSMSAFINLDSRKSSDTETLKTQDHYLQIPSASTSVMSTPNKSVTDFSDVEGDSFKSIDFETEMTSSPTTVMNLIERGAETMSLKSTDSINSFFNSIASNTETVSKFFRKSSTESPAHQPKMNESADEKSMFEFSISQLKDENTELPDSQTLPETAELALEDPKLDETLELAGSTSSIEPARELYIGTIFDQSIVEYIVRLVSSKFLLEGTPNVLVSDQIIRVSIKNLALSVLVECVELKSDVLMMKLQKDFTDESMMVESLLSYLVDEDLRLEEEEKKKTLPTQDEAAANTSESFMEIKDDHFGECTTATFLDYFSPLSKSLDEQGLISLKNRIYEEKSKDREESAKKINRDLCQLLNRSEMVESKLPLMETTLKMPDDKDCQFVADVLLYSTHSDPVLRGNVYMIVGSFIGGILKRNLDYKKFIARNDVIIEVLEFDRLIQMIVRGLKDEIHTVVKQTLTAVESLSNQMIAVMSKADIEKLMDNLLAVFCSKYWLVQCKYCDVITRVDLKLLRARIGAEKAELYQRQIIEQMFELVKDNDFRVRNHVSELLPVIIQNLCKDGKASSESTNYLSFFVSENLFNFEAFFVDLKDQSDNNVEIELQLTRILYIMSNFLMDVKDKNQHFGVIYGLKVLLRKFSPLSYPKAWKEFNVLSVLLSFVNRNPGIALDISCQCDMIEVIATLIGSNGIMGSAFDSNEFLLHLMRIVNIYGHLVSNTKPLIVPKQKGKDLFTSSKELAIINSLGFFSNNHFYLKLYLVLKSSYESYRMTINQDAEGKLKQLLHVTLKSLQTLLELRTMTKEDVKLLEETIHYLNQLTAFQPEDCIVTTKILFKFLFRRNFANRKNDLDNIKSLAELGNASEVFEKYESFSSFDAIEVVRENNFETSIKQFDPLVIQGLRSFSKSPAKLQATILDMLCQLLEFNVNYMQLDAKKVFVDFVMRQLEYIECGLVIDGNLLAPKIIQFLIYLTKLKDKKFITIPKIINIIDNLLAMTNPVVKECGVKALLVLMNELFFKKTVFKGEPEVIEANNKEINAQQEVVISMMLKFLDHQEVQDNLIWMLMKAKTEPLIEEVTDENEIHHQLMQSIKDEPKANHSLIRLISKNIVLESKNFEAVVGLYCSILTDHAAIDLVDTMTIIQDQVLMKAEEVYLINHVKLHQQKTFKEDVDPTEAFLDIHLKFLLKLLKVNDANAAEKTLKFLSFKRFPTLLDAFKKRLNVREILRASSAASLQSFDVIIRFILSLDVKKEEIVGFIKNQNDMNESKLVEIYHKNLFIKRNDINAWQNEELMDFFKDAERLEVLLKFSENILLDSLLEDHEISRIILKKLTMVKIPLARVKYLLENVVDECLVDSLNYAIAETVHESVHSRIIQLTMSKKLHSVRNEIMMGRENVKVSVDDMEKVAGKLVEFKISKKFPTFAKSIEEFINFLKSKHRKDIPVIDSSDLNKTLDEQWLLSRAKGFVCGSNDVANGKQIAEMLLELKSESKLITLLTNEDFNIKLLPSTLSVSFEKMLKSFRLDCIQINPHLNYMKVSPLLKISILILMKNLDKANESTGFDQLNELAEVMSIFMKWIQKLYNVSLIYIEAKLVEKFVGEHLLKSSFNGTLIKFFKLLVTKMRNSAEPSEVFVDAVQDILSQNRIWTDLNELNDTKVNELVTFIHEHMTRTLKNTDFVARYEQPQLFDKLSNDLSERVEIAKQIIFLAKIQENYEDGEMKSVAISSKARKIIEKLFAIARNLLRLNQFYHFAVTPYEILLSYRSGDDLLVLQNEASFKLKQIPIEYLSDSELLEHYIRRINRYGFTERHQFEEVFMTLLVLLNQWNEMQDAEEQFNIKQLCLQTNVELIVSCFRHPVIGVDENDFFHFPRSEKMKMHSIGLKKLHHIQETLDSNLNVFYQPNLERIGTDNNSISCSNFDMNQFALNYTWQMIESREEVASAGSILSRNVTFYHEKCGIDFKSALQLIYDLMTQMIDENPVLVLPQLVKLVDVLDNSEQFRWIHKKMLSLHETIAGEDTISHQFIAYLLCRSAAVLVPSLSEVQQLQVIINKYLGCNQVFVRTACIHGMLTLFESLCKTNTTMGGMSDEMKLMRNCIINYTNKNGIIFESNISSPKHDKLVWTLNFSVIEMTSKFVPDCDILGDSVISANNILKRTNDLDLFYLILNGLERLVILHPENKMYREKIEKLSLDLMKLENKLYSIGGLKLLVTCLYIGSLEQLENTEKSNGIVQDEPEILMQSTEKIEILFTRIRTATIDEAEIYGKVLGQILKDLLPANEILTKVIKELLIMNQSNCVCIATIIHQVFRSAIDSSFLVLLQEWLICSLQNFLSYPNNKKAIWFLSLIFLSSTLNQNLLKLFPILLDENLDNSELHRLFLVSAKDFYEKLTEQQRVPFKDAFLNRMKTKMMSSSACSTHSPSNSFAFNNSLFQILLQHL